MIYFFYRICVMVGFKENVCFCCCFVFGCKLCLEIFLVFMMIGVVVGFIISVLVNGFVNVIEILEDKKIILILIGFFGEFFINMFKMLVVFLIVVSFVCVFVGIDVKVNG